MDDIPLCPPWWPRLIWDLHYWPRPGGGGNPVNYPPAIDDLMASLTVHTMSYLMIDQGRAAELRSMASKSMVETAEKLSKMHDEAVGALEA
jgi:hypothetical protein